MISSNNSSLIQHLLVPGTVLSALYQLPFQQHHDVDTIIIYILMIGIRMVNSVNVTQVINDRTRAPTRSV